MGENGITTGQTPDHLIQFSQFFHHFVKYNRNSKEKPVLLLIENHDSHLSIEALDYFKENDVLFCSTLLQPETSRL